MSALRTTQVLADIVAGHQADKARIISHLADKLGVSAQELCNVASIPPSTCYKHLSELSDAQLVFRLPSKGRQDKWGCLHFEVKLGLDVRRRELEQYARAAGGVRKGFPKEIEQLSKTPIVITPRNVPVYASAEAPAARLFIKRHGWEQYVKFANLYEEYRRGKVPVFLMARELGATEFEVNALLSDIEDFMRGK